MKTHTVICGTSKSRNENGYYIKERKKFWGTIYKAGITNELISPYDYKKFEKLGFQFKEIVPLIITQDKYIDFDNYKLLEYVKKFSHSLEEIKPKRVFFHGKKAAHWFIQFRLKGKVTKNSYSMTTNRKYGLQTDLNMDFDIYILPSTSGQAAKYWNQNIWEEAWKKTLNDIPQ